jgi:hypothetical protein
LARAFLRFCRWCGGGSTFGAAQKDERVLSCSEVLSFELIVDREV